MRHTRPSPTSALLATATTPRTTRTTRTSRSLLVGLALALVAVLVQVPSPAAATAHTVDSVVPQSGGTAGGYPVRIYGDGFTGATAVRFGAVSAIPFEVIDDNLITAVVPGGGTNNTFVNVKVFNGGSVTLADGFFYTNATLTVAPDTGLAAGDTVTVTLDGYEPSTGFIVPELNPLQVYYEGLPVFPEVPPALEPPYVDTLLFPPAAMTDASGDAVETPTLTDPFNADEFVPGPPFDAEATCPVTMTTANFLGTSAPASDDVPSYAGRCLIVTNQFGTASIEEPITFATDTTPAAPTLTTNTTSVTAGATLTITSGTRWNANPFYGSSTAATLPGQTVVTVNICGLGGVPSACSTTPGTATVTMTRYIDQVFSGATITGSIVVGADVTPAACSSCRLRVRQSRPGGTFIQRFVNLTVT